MACTADDGRAHASIEPTGGLAQERRDFIGWHLYDHAEDRLARALAVAILQQILHPVDTSDVDKERVHTMLRNGSSSAMKRLKHEPGPQPFPGDRDVIELIRQAVKPSSPSKHPLRPVPVEIGASQNRDAILGRAHAPGTVEAIEQPTPALETPLLPRASLRDASFCRPRLVPVPFSESERALDVPLQKATENVLSQESLERPSPAVVQLVKAAVCPTSIDNALACERPDLKKEEETVMHIFDPLPGGRFKAPDLVLPTPLQVIRKVNTEVESSSIAHRLLHIVDCADDISTLSVSTSQSSASNHQDAQAHIVSEPDSTVALPSVGESSAEESVNDLSIKALMSIHLGTNLATLESEHCLSTKLRPTHDEDAIPTCRTVLKRVKPVVVAKAPACESFKKGRSTSLADRVKGESLDPGSLCVLPIPPSSPEPIVKSNLPRFCSSADLLKKIRIAASLELAVQSRGIGRAGRPRVRSLTETVLRVDETSTVASPSASRLANAVEQRSLASSVISMRCLTPSADQGPSPSTTDTEVVLQSASRLIGNSEHGDQGQRSMQTEDEDVAIPSVVNESVPAPNQTGLQHSSATTSHHDAEAFKTISPRHTPQPAGSRYPKSIRVDRQEAVLLEAVHKRRRHLKRRTASADNTGEQSPLDDFLRQRLAQATSTDASRHSNAVQIPRTEETYEQEGGAGHRAARSVDSKPQGLADPAESPSCQHRYVVSVRMLQNVAVLSELQKLKVDIIERDGVDVDIICDPTSAVVVVKASLLAESLQEVDALPLNNLQGPKTRGMLRRLLTSTAYDDILVVCELYTTSGLPFEVTPPVQAAAKLLQDLLAMRDTVAPTRTSFDNDSEGPDDSQHRRRPIGHPRVRLEYAQSPAEAARCCRRFADALQERCDVGPYAGSGETPRLTPWTSRECWLRRAPSDDELMLSAWFNPLAAAFAAALRSLDEERHAMALLRVALGDERADAFSLP